MEISKYEGTVAVGMTPYSQVVSPEQKAEQKRLIHAVEAINRAEVLGSANELVFSIDKRTSKPVMKIVNRQTKEIVQQIPPEYVLRLADGLNR